MFDTFYIALRESLQCAFLLLLLVAHPATRRYFTALFSGVVVAVALGALVSYAPWGAGLLPSLESWTTLRFSAEILIFLIPLALLACTCKPRSYALWPLMFMLGIMLFFFEAKAVFFMAREAGVLAESSIMPPLIALGGIIAGLLVVLLSKSTVSTFKADRYFTLASLFVLLGTVNFITGGVGELEGRELLITLQRGMSDFLVHLIDYMRGVLLMDTHPFFYKPHEGFWAFLSGGDFTTVLVTLFILTPPMAVLLSIFTRPDPILRDVTVPAERRLKLAFFRTEMLYNAAPAIISFVLIFVALHAVNISLNPMHEPSAIPVLQSEEQEGKIVISLSDKSGDFTDGKLRKYVYLWGDKQIFFMAIMKSDGTLGVALDECEICKPADWNADAKGYAQTGEHLVCKYCMTPIATGTVNKPGGCNPIPFPFEVKDGELIINIEDLTRVHKAAKNLDKAGSHL